MTQALPTLSRLFRALNENPAYKKISLSVLDFCTDEQAELDVLEFCESQRIEKNQINSPANLIEMLVKHEGLTQRILVDGSPYAGTVTDLQTDELIPDDAVIEVRYITTALGKQILAKMREAHSFENLVSSCPQRTDAFLDTLKLCAQETGATTREIQDMLKQSNRLEPDPITTVDGLHASYFTSALESIDALAWSGTGWITSESGLAILKSL